MKYPFFPPFLRFNRVWSDHQLRNTPPVKTMIPIINLASDSQSQVYALENAEK